MTHKLHVVVIKIYWNTCMQFNALQLYLNGLVSFFTFFELSTSLHELNHPLWTYKNHYSMLHIALTNIYWNTHNNLMFHTHTHTHIWMWWWIFSQFLNNQHLYMSWIIHFECVKSITHKITFCTHHNVLPLYLNALMIRWNVHACQI
jgi:hypothetical protein